MVIDNNMTVKEQDDILTKSQYKANRNFAYDGNPNQNQYRNDYHASQTRQMDGQSDSSVSPPQLVEGRIIS